MIALYGHPFASFVWKPLIALYERGLPFEFRVVDPEHPEHQQAIATRSPTGQMPALVDGDTTVTGSNAVIDYLDGLPGAASPMVPTKPSAAIEARMMADVFDDYVNTPMQRIVAEAFRADGEKNPRGVADAHATLERSYRWLDRRLADRAWAAGDCFTIADCAAAPALFYADWVHPIGDAWPALARLRARLLARPSIARVVDEARPYRAFFPLGAPARD